MKILSLNSLTVFTGILKLAFASHRIIPIVASDDSPQTVSNLEIAEGKEFACLGRMIISEDEAKQAIFRPKRFIHRYVHREDLKKAYFIKEKYKDGFKFIYYSETTNDDRFTGVVNMINKQRVMCHVLNQGQTNTEQDLDKTRRKNVEASHLRQIAHERRLRYQLRGFRPW